MEPILKESTIPLNNIHKSILPRITPWIIKNPKDNLQLNQIYKTKTQKKTPTKKNIEISSKSIPTTHVSIQIDPKTTIKQHVQQS